MHVSGGVEAEKMEKEDKSLGGLQLPLQTLIGGELLQVLLWKEDGWFEQGVSEGLRKMYI